MSWWAPLAIAVALSLRSPNVGGVADYQVSSGAEWSWLKVDVMLERETGRDFYGYDLNGDHGILGDWRLAYDSHLRQASDIDRQSLVVGRPVYRGIACGAGVVAHAYSKPKGAVDLSIPLPGGRFTYTTDFKLVHVTMAESCLDLSAGKGVDLFILGRIFHDRRTDWQVKGGVKVHLTGREAVE